MPLIPDLQPTGGTYKPAVPSLGAAMAGGKALADVGRDIVGVAELGMDAAIKIKEGRELGAMNEARLAMQRTQASHEEFRAQNPDNEDAWESDIVTRIDTTREELLKKPGLSPEFRAKLSEQFGQWKNEYATKTRTDALIHGRARDRTTTSQLVRAYRRSGKYDEARKAVEEAKSQFSDAEREADLVDIDFEEQEQRKRDVATKYELGIQDDPIAALEVLSAKGKDGFLNEPEMEDGTRFRLLRQAERELAIKKADEFETLKGAIDRHELTATELERLPIYLGKPEKRSLAVYLKRNTPPTDDEARKAWKEIETIRQAFNTAKAGTMDEVTYRNAHRDARARILELIPQGYSGPLMESLQHYSPARIYDMKPTAPPSREDVKKDLAIEVRSTLGAAYDAEIFGPIGEDTPPMEKEKAARKRRDLENKALDWIATQKDLTPEGARAYTDSLLSTERVKSTAADLRQFVPGSAQRLRPAPAMPPLPPKQSAKDKASADPLQIPPGNGTASADLLPSKQLDTFLDQ